MSRWRRLARLVQQSRIRLPAAPIDAAELRTGDWVQIGSERWRVAARRVEADRVVFRLRPRRGRACALLTGPRRAAGNWSFETDGSEVVLPPELLVVFPVV